MSFILPRPSETANESIHLGIRALNNACVDDIDSTHIRTITIIANALTTRLRLTFKNLAIGPEESKVRKPTVHEHNNTI